MKVTEEYVRKMMNNNEEQQVYSLIKDHKAEMEVNQKLYNMLGIISYNQKDISNANYFFAMSLLMNIDNIDDLINSGIIRFIENELDESIDFFTQAKKLSNDQQLNNQVNQYLIEIMRKKQNGVTYKRKITVTFLEELLNELINNMSNQNFNDIDLDRYNKNEANTVLNNGSINYDVAYQIAQYIEGISFLYENLGDEQSKETLKGILSYRILGHLRVKLNLNNSLYWSERKYIKDLKDSEEKIAVGFKGWELEHYDLSSLGYPIKMFYLPMGIHATFVRKQYEHTEVKVEKDDYVIDAGGCYGDTALFFAEEVGPRGKVFTFEFIKSNLEIMKRNIDINPAVSSTITIVSHPLWSISGNELFYIDNGPGSSLSEQPISRNKTTTISIDDFVVENSVAKIDFIKMDIEGAELNALKGAEKTILKFRPKMAISIYHKIEDFSEIHKYIDGLNCDYSFYLDHFTTFAEETILYAKPNKRPILL
ncbi:FkbM family methyltransferase [Sporosarcina sp. FSL K6-1508]|uniref:FkbM family methyltransferase n=1 Tax=Sporosarcina sp. FSL K6-1508 TaxID=2921553 RepID=UPI0030F923C1